MDRFKRSVEISGAWDKTHSDPNKNYGVHGVDMRFMLKGEEGAVQFVLYTNWHLPEVSKQMRSKCSPNRFCYMEPLPADIGYHSTKPTYKGQELMTESCEYLDGKPCYYDGSGLHAREVFEIMVRRGGEAMWQELEKFYSQTFNPAKGD